MSVTVGGVRLRVHPALLGVLLLAAVLGAGDQWLVAIASLALHEMAHGLAASAMRVGLREIELTPFGGAARMQNLWTLRKGQVALIALAGPAVNGVLVLLAAALCAFSVITPERAAIWVKVNALLGGFNLLPALPLDGGRIACALLEGRLGRARAVKWGIMAGRALAGLLLALSVALFLRERVLQLTLPLCAAFLFSAVEKERSAAMIAPLDGLLNRADALREEGALPVCALAVRADTPVELAVSRLKRRSVNRLDVYTDEMRFLGTLDERILMDAMMDGKRVTVRELLL